MQRTINVRKVVEAYETDDIQCIIEMVYTDCSPSGVGQF
jgi:hypothetical protein